MRRTHDAAAMRTTMTRGAEGICTQRTIRVSYRDAHVASHLSHWAVQSSRNTSHLGSDSHSRRIVALSTSCTDGCLSADHGPLTGLELTSREDLQRECSSILRGLTRRCAVASAPEELNEGTVVVGALGSRWRGCSGQRTM